ncbi:MAG: class I SAM-dependent methyltransferase [PVC group bacterium]|nr:class I SAM-dependent methyltransferase [PVC group bacterium]
MSEIDQKISSLLKKYKVSAKDKKVIDSFVKQAIEYIACFQQFEQKIKGKPYKKSLQRIFDKEQNKLITTLYTVDRKIKSSGVKFKMRALFREIGKKYIFKSGIAKRIYDRPQGYPGDFLTFEIFYDNKPISKGAGEYLDVWALRHVLSLAATYRKNNMQEILKKIISGKRKKIKILNVGCGSSREIRDLLTENMNLSKKLSIICLDQDKDALNYSKKCIKALGNDIDVKFLQEDILSLIGVSKKQLLIGRQDIIYSLGVADYFLKTALGNFIKFCYSRLNPGGKLIIAFCSSHNPKLYVHLRWFCEWNFFINDAKKIRDFIVKDLGIKKTKIVWEKPKPVFLALMEK